MAHAQLCDFDRVSGTPHASIFDWDHAGSTTLAPAPGHDADDDTRWLGPWSENPVCDVDDDLDDDEAYFLDDEDGDEDDDFGDDYDDDEFEEEDVDTELDDESDDDDL